MKHVECDKRVLGIVKKSRYNIKTGVFVYTVKSFKGEAEHVIKGESAVTVVSFKDLDIPDVIDFKKDLVEIVILSPRSIEEVPGVVNYFYSLFTQAGINIVETLSCFTDTIIIIEKKDLIKAIELLDKIMK